MNSPPGIWSILPASVTFLAVLVALFREEIRAWWHRPVLSARIKLAPPDCHRCEVTVANPMAQFAQKGSAFFFRIWVQNDGRLRAEKVQVFIHRLQKQQADGRFRDVDTFLPMNLRWSHSSSPEIFADGISPGMGKHCDFGQIFDPEFRKGLRLPVPADFDENETILGLYLEVEPSTLSHLLTKGKYRFFVKIASANSLPIEKCWEVALTGLWMENESAMFSEGIGIVPLKVDR